jgi:stage II sporulation protein D
LSTSDQQTLRRGHRTSATSAVVVAVLGLLLASVSFVVAVEPTAPPIGTLPAEPITFYGRGYGHGVGMSQYGARGRALAGQDAATILAHYYAGTTIATVDPMKPVRVLVLSRFKPTASTPLRLNGRGAPWTIDGIDGTFPTDAALAVTQASTGFRLVVTNLTGGVLLDRAAPGDLRVRAGATSTGGIQVWAKPGRHDTYRGVIRLRSTSAGVDAVNETELDLYLRGVVPAEMPYSWPGEALKAQAIAARSYTVRRLHPATGSFDLYDDSRSQVYRGMLGEKATTNAAIEATTGQILLSGSEVADALFHSTGGGATEDNERAFVSSAGTIVLRPVSYLRGSPDRAPDGTSYDGGARRAAWQTAAYTLAQLSTVFAGDARTSVGTLTGIDLSNRGVSGRLVSVTLTGSDGTRTVSGEVFRAVFNARTPAADPYMWSTLVDTAPIP